MVDLDDRLRDTARHATAGLTLTDPTTGDVVELDPHGLDGTGAARRRARRPRRVATLAAAAAVVAVVAAAGLWTRGPSTTSQLEAAGPAAEGAVPTTAALSPAARLREAVDATLASDSFQVRSVAVVPGGDQLLAPHPGGALMPAIVGSGEHGGVLHTVADGLVESAWTEAPARSIRDSAAGATYWEVAAGEWQRAVFEEMPVVESIRALADLPCVAAAERPGTLIVLEGDGPCPDDLALGGPGQLRWAVTLRTDGRLDSVVPVREAGAVVDARSDQIFGGYDTSSVTLPDPARVTDVATPFGSYIDATTGYSQPMYTKG